MDWYTGTPIGKSIACFTNFLILGLREIGKCFYCMNMWIALSYSLQ